MGEQKKMSALDLPNSYIGKTVPRPNARRLAEGRGRFVDDLSLPRMVHAAVLRSPGWCMCTSRAGASPSHATPASTMCRRQLTSSP